MRRTEKERLAWSIVGCMNAIAMLIVAIIVGHGLGYTIQITWQMIVGGALVVILIAFVLIRSMVKK